MHRAVLLRNANTKRRPLACKAGLCVPGELPLIEERLGGYFRAVAPAGCARSFIVVENETGPVRVIIMCLDKSKRI